MIHVGFIFLTYDMGPERCYQWQDPEFVDKYYKSLKERAQKEQTQKSLMENLWKEPSIVEVKSSKEEKPFHKKADAKDAFYFIDM